MNARIQEYRKSDLSYMNQFTRMLWGVVNTLFIKPLPRGLGQSWIHLWLRIFGAKIHKTAKVYSGVKIYYPANLVMEEYSSIAPGVDCYNVDKITIKAFATISQNTTLCTASHDITDISRPLTTAPITIGEYAWVAAEVFVSMGITIGEYAVVGARSLVINDVEPWTVVGGHPAKFLKNRTLKKSKQ